MRPYINLMSDTQSTPTEEMRRAMAWADVGDEQSGLDPSVNRLCAQVSEMLGYEAALFAPSGTMCNQLGVLVHCSAGDEIICDASSHLVNTEGAGAAALAGTAIRAVATPMGIFNAADVEASVRSATRTGPRSRLVVAEQTVNFLGGRVWPLAELKSVTAAARAHGLSAHLDGARLFNATVATGTAPIDYCAGAGFDSAWIDLSKGLGCPVGAVLCGSKEFIDDAWRWKYRLGGAMRQAGILAAAGLYALEQHVERLAEDHLRARKLVEALDLRVPGLVDPAQVETNIVLIDTAVLGVPAADFAKACRERGVLLSVIGKNRLRAVPHINTSDDDLVTAIDAIAVAASVAGEAGSAQDDGSWTVYQ